jgi:hypothetical protein
VKEFGCAVLIALASGAAQVADRLEFTLPSSITQGEPVMLDVLVKNETAVPWIVDFGFSYVENFRFSVTSAGAPAREVRPLGRDGFQPTGRVEIPAHQSGSAFIAMNEWIDLRRPGNYTVAIRFLGSITVNGRALVLDRTPVVRELKILPRDEAVLRRRCEEFLAVIKSGSDRERVVLALSFTTDPIAVPFLLESAEHRGLAIEEVAGLERIGGDAARSALEKLAKGPNSWTAAAAAAALRRR